ncbi:sensor histidine kinase [Sphingomonas bacterium]|uniref:sensor histidine kinase n=1 Tax=Sphingomonas bacterium TaxID=1895847 RepID=UPI001576E82F|nr:histidine kinase dimerization/phosphoacceptor domain -containing protein [Sphingomonas bacterium]
MTVVAEPSRADRRWFEPARWPTGAKLFLALSLALLPLAIVTALATWQTARVFNDEARARLRTAAERGSRAIGLELVGDMQALRTATQALDRDPADTPVCARVQGIFAAQAASSVRFVVTDPQGRTLCGARFAGIPRHEHRTGGSSIGKSGAGSDSPVMATLLPGEGLVLSVDGGRRHASAAALFSGRFLARIAQPDEAASGYGTTIEGGDARLPLLALPATGARDRRETIRTALGIGDLTLAMDMRAAPITWPLVLALLLPLLMWVAAASIAWLVVDRLLVHPLRRLRASVAVYRPGDVIEPGAPSLLPAQEIVDLGDTFRAISRTVALHEAGLAEGLVRQTRLTREVHHRVKNNLQVISSLISIHARGSRGADAAAAYSSIQRRVDALAVVHRNHFAESEANRGLPLRSVLGELTSNIRATAPEESAHLGLTLDIDPVLVSQDVAVAVAFMVTEMIELAMTVDPAAQIRIALQAPPDRPDRATLSVTSVALTGSAGLARTLSQRYGRVIDGLARQLRAPLSRDESAGRYRIDIAVTGRD